MTAFSVLFDVQRLGLAHVLEGLQPFGGATV
jgi:hypothetical protein